MKPKITITKEEIRKLKSKVRREIDILAGEGVDRKHQVFVDRKKEKSRKHCRAKKVDE